MAVTLHLLLLFGPAVLALATQGSARLPGWLNPVVLCYAVGVAAGNLGLPLDRGLIEGVVTGAVLIAIPLLLLPADLVAWLRRARSVAIACALCFASVGVATFAASLLFAPSVPDGWVIAGMLLGTYTGSAPNMVAVGTSLGARPETIVLITTADLIVGGSFCFVLLSPAVGWVGRWLAPYPRLAGDEPADAGDELRPGPALGLSAIAPRAWALSLGLGVLLAAAGGALALAVPPGQQQLVAILGATSLGVVCSLHRKVRSLPASAPLGELFVLVFCIGLGSLADLRALADVAAAGQVLLWTAASMFGGVLLHLLLCRPLGIDRDTALITVTAAIYGPAFVPPVAANLRNRELVLSGVTAALAGLAVGNYLGIGMAWAVRAAVE